MEPFRVLTSGSSTKKTGGGGGCDAGFAGAALLLSVSLFAARKPGKR